MLMAMIVQFRLYEASARNSKCFCIGHGISRQTRWQEVAVGLSTFGVQRSAKVENESLAESSDREELIDPLTELNETYQECTRSTSKLKSEVVGLNTSLKEESYSSMK